MLLFLDGGLKRIVQANKEYTMILKKYRKQNGLDYDGWWLFLLKRWLRHHGLGFLVPFTFVQDDYKYGIQCLYVYRWGRLTVEQWLWPDHRDIEILDRLRKNGIRNDKVLYKVIQSEAHSTFFKEIAL